MYDENVEKTIEYGKFYGKPQISLKPIRLRQDPVLANEIINIANNKMNKSGVNKVEAPLFFVGSVDFMVKNENRKKHFYILETNGGNSRGFSALPIEHWQKANISFGQSLSFVRTSRPVVLIGYPDSDLLLYEKIFLSKYLAGLLAKDSKDAEAVHIANLSTERLGKGGLVVIGSYGEILNRLSVAKNNFVYLDKKKVDILIGDGIARRKPEIIKHLAKNDLKSLVVNDVFFITDDKALTYLAVMESESILRKFSIEPIDFRRANNKKQLSKVIDSAMHEIPEILIKPHGGSGGSGIDIIAKKNQIEKKINSSIEHYHSKFGQNRDPFPYTVCQRVHATPVKWSGDTHHFDIRVYVGRHKNKIVPLGALMRIALEPFTGRFSKKSFVVNLSGYKGVDTSRGFGLHKDSLDLFNLDKKDFVDMFSGACALIASINNNYASLMRVAAKNEKIKN